MGGAGDADGQSCGASVGIAASSASCGSDAYRSSRSQSSGPEVALLSRSTRTLYVPGPWQLPLSLSTTR